MLHLISYYLLLLIVTMNFLSVHNKVNDEMNRSLIVQRNKRTAFLRNSGVGVSFVLFFFFNIIIKRLKKHNN